MAFHRPLTRQLVLGALLAVGIVACSGGKDSTGNTTPVPTPVATVQITSAPSALLLVGDTIRMAAVALSATGTPIASQAITWTSSANAVASVSATGVLVAGDAGAAIITATAGSKTAQVTVDVAYGAALTTAGGTISAAGGRFLATVTGLGAPTRFVVRPAATAPADARTLAATAFEITPASQAFFGTSTLTLQFDPTALPAGIAKESLQLYALSAPRGPLSIRAR